MIYEIRAEIVNSGTGMVCQNPTSETAYMTSMVNAAGLTRLIHGRVWKQFA